jgi:OTT_1508-like deaminase
MFIHALPESGKVLLSLPKSTDEWESLIGNILQLRPYVASKEWCQDEAIRLYEVFRNQKLTGMVHCECKLISYLTDSKDAWSEIPALGYIGVSKLSCRPCYKWIKAYNSLGGPQFHIRGTHGKWYPSWVMPTTSAKPGLEEKFIHSMIHQYCGIQKHYMDASREEKRPYASEEDWKRVIKLLPEMESRMKSFNVELII